MTQGKVLNRLTEMHLTFYTKAFVGDDTPCMDKGCSAVFWPILPYKRSSNPEGSLLQLWALLHTCLLGLGSGNWWAILAVYFVSLKPTESFPICKLLCWYGVFGVICSDFWPPNMVHIIKVFNFGLIWPDPCTSLVRCRIPEYKTYVRMGSFLAQTSCGNWFGSRSNPIHTIKEPLWGSFGSLWKRWPLCGCFCPHPRAVTVFRSAQTNYIKPEFDLNGLNTAGMKIP